MQYGEGSEDIAAETWLQIVRDLPSFIGTAAGFRGWLFTIARHRMIDASRARAARPFDPVGDITLVTAAERVAAAPSAENEAMDQLSTKRALDLVATLPREQAELVALRVIAGLDVQAVAEIVGKTPGAVRVSVHRGLRTLSRDPGLTQAEVI